MAIPSFENHIEELDESKNRLQHLKNEWLMTIEDLAKAKAEMKDEDVFSMINYLAFCDQLCQTLCIDLREIDFHLKRLEEFRKKLLQSHKNLNFIDSLITDFKEFGNSKLKKIQNIDDHYPVLADRVLRRSDDLIARFSEIMQQEKIVPNLKTELRQNLEKELFLQELKDSLESYREARESFISELTGADFQKLTESLIPEDLGEEKPEIDSILSQLDTAITSCDAVLLNQEIGD